MLLIAPRRIGKTSLMREAGQQLGQEFLCLQVDLQKSANPEEAILELSMAVRPHISLWGKVLALFSNILDQVAGRIQSLRKSDVTIALRAGINSGNWQAKGDRILEILSKSEKPVVVFFDELPILVAKMLRVSQGAVTAEARANAESFMSWLRSNSIRHQGKIRMVITGSIGLRPLLRKAGLSASLNNFMPFTLGPWSQEIAAKFFDQIAADHEISLERGVASYMAELIGFCIPHYVRMFFEHVYRYSKMNKVRSFSRQTVHQIYQENMLGPLGRTEVSHYEERLRLLGTQDYQLAVAFLTEASVAGQLTERSATQLASRIVPPHQQETAIRDVKMILEHDGYLQRDSKGEYRFVSPLLKDWWSASFYSGNPAPSGE